MKKYRLIMAAALSALLLACGCTNKAVQNEKPVSVVSSPVSKVSTPSEVSEISAIESTVVSESVPEPAYSEISSTASTSSTDDVSSESRNESLISDTEQSVEPSELSQQEESSSDDTSQTEPSESSVHDLSSDDPEDSPVNIEGLENKYFVKKLSEQELKDFACLYHAVVNCEQKAEFSHDVPSDQLDKMMFLLNYDCPELIHVSGDYMPYYSDVYSEYVTGVRFTYHMTKDEYQKCREELETFRKQLQENTRDMNPYETEMYVYQMLFEQTVFDDYAARAGSVYGALIEHRARCEGISKAFAWCMQSCGVECLTVAGIPLWENNGAYAGHSWNIIHLEDGYYHVDLTADNLKNYSGEVTVPLYGFLNADDEQVRRTHLVNDFFVSLGVPECTSDLMNYHKRLGQYIGSDDNMQNCFDIILQNRYHEGENTQISIRLDTSDTYQYFIDSWEDWFEQFRQMNGYSPCNSTIYYNDVALTVVIDIRTV